MGMASVEEGGSESGTKKVKYRLHLNCLQKALLSRYASYKCINCFTSQFSQDFFIRRNRFLRERSDRYDKIIAIKCFGEFFSFSHELSVAFIFAL